MTDSHSLSANNTCSRFTKPGNWMPVLLRVSLAGIFIYSGVGKFFDLPAFALNIAAFNILPGSILPLLAAYIPLLEILAGICILLPVWKREAAFILIISVLIFSIAVASAWVRGLDVSCGCFGKSGTLDSYPLWILRNMLLLGLLIFFYVKCLPQKSRSGSSEYAAEL